MRLHRCCLCRSVCCSVLQCVAVCCSVLQCGAACCSVLQCGAVCCSVLQCVAVCHCLLVLTDLMLQCVAVCCSVLQCVAVSCGVFALLSIVVAVCCSMLQCVVVRTRLMCMTHMSWAYDLECVVYIKLVIHIKLAVCATTCSSHVYHASPCVASRHSFAHAY